MNAKKPEMRKQKKVSMVGEMVHLVTKKTDVMSRNNKGTVKWKEQQEYADGIQYSLILADRERERESL